MENNAELIRLEEFVDKLLTRFNHLKADYHALQETLRERDAECTDLKETVANLSSERTEVGSRVAGLIGRIEQWESEHSADRGAVEHDSAFGNPQASLFGTDSDSRVG